LNKNKHIDRIIFIFTLVLICLPGCEKKSDTGLSFERLSFGDISYRDIPGVTEEEINAIEELQKQGASFSINVPHSIELFKDENGQLCGYTLLLCEWLSALFEMRFYPKIEELSAIIQKLDAGEAFFGSQVITEDRLRRYLMTDPIDQPAFS